MRTSSAQNLSDQMSCSQTGLFALEYALAELWQSWGIRPSWLLGHGVGEYVAACVAGVFSLEDAMRLVAARARLMQELPEDGAMLAVWTDEAQAARALEGHHADVSLAAVNEPHQVVISGRASVVELFAQKFSAEGVQTRRLKVSRAYHSPLVEPMLAQFAEVAAKISYHEPRRSVVSTLTGRSEGHRMSCPEYWCEHVRQTVRFAAGVESLFAEGAKTFVEIGPHATLLDLTRTCWDTCERPGNVRLLGSLHPTLPDEEVMLSRLGQLYVGGEEIDWSGFAKSCGGRRISLPSYPFQHRRFRVQTSLAPASGSDTGRPLVHPLLGVRWVSAATADWLQFDASLAPEKPSYLGGHRLWGVAVYPATAYLEMALAAARQLRSEGEGTFELREVAWERALCFEEDRSQRVQFIMRPEGDGYQWEVFSSEDDAAANGHPQWIRHAVGRLLHRAVQERPGVADVAQLRSRLTDELPVEGFYARLRATGLEYGENFRGLAGLWRGEGEWLGEVRLPSALHTGLTDYQFHPALLDACLHALAAALGDDRKTVPVPAGVERLEVWGRPQTTILSHGRLREAGGQEQPGRQVADIELLDREGAVLARLTGLRLQEVRPELILGRRQEDGGRREPSDAATAAPTMNLVELRSLAPAEQRDRMVAFLAEQASAVLGLGASDKADAGRSIVEMGMDSMMGVEFIYRINRGLKMNLPAEKLLEKPYLFPLAEEIVTRLRDAGAPAIAVSATAAATAVVDPVSDNAWFPFRRIRAAARARLFCFHGSENTAAVFADWADKVREEIEVFPVEPPSCGGRATEETICDQDVLMETLGDMLLEHLDRPFAFFGHAEGAVLALRLACQVQERFGLCPAHLFIGASVPPQGQLQGGFDCPVTVFWPKRDSTVTRDDLFEWCRHLAGDFRIESLPMGQADYLSDAGRLLHIIARDLIEALAQ